MAADPNIQLSLVVPVWNGAERLPRTLAALDDFASTRSVELIFVDDHSSPPTSEILREFCAGREGTTLLRNARNQGKGYAVARGVEAARGRNIIFTDADLAYPPSEIVKIQAALEAGADVAIACRALPESRSIVSPGSSQALYMRDITSRVFNRLVRVALALDHDDTQAGLKGFTWEAARTIFSRVAVTGFGFDVECLYIAALHALDVEEVPVMVRYDAEGSTVRIIRDAARMARDVARVRWRGWRNWYA